MTEQDPLLDRGSTPGGRWRHTTTVATGLSREREGLKFGRAGAHEVYTDERPEFGGEGSDPTPLAYFALAAGWCVISQLLRYAKVRGVVIHDATCEVDVDWSLGGSARRGDINAACDAVRYRMVIDSPSPAAEVEQVAALARQGCFVEQALRNPTPTEMELDIRGSVDPDGASRDVG